MSKHTRYFDDYVSAYNYYGGTEVPSNEIALIGNASYIFVSSDNSYDGGNTQYFDANMTNDTIVNTMVSTSYDSGYTAGTSYGYELGYVAGTSYGESIGYTSGYNAGYEAGYSYGYSYGYSEGQAAGGGQEPNVIINSLGHGSTSGTGYYETGSYVTAEAYSYSGYQFSAWRDSNNEFNYSVVNPITIHVESGFTTENPFILYAQFIEEVQYETCPICGGTGTVEISESRECPNCGGTGMVEEIDPETGEPMSVTCPTCNGSGSIDVPISRTCDYCDGTGQVPVE